MMEPREIIARVTAAAIYRPQPDMSGDIWRAMTPMHRRRAEDAADTVLAALREAGLVIVPREPTEEMIEAGDKGVEWNSSDLNGSWYVQGVDLAEAYRAMISVCEPREEER